MAVAVYSEMGENWEQLSTEGVLIRGAGEEAGVQHHQSIISAGLIQIVCVQCSF